MMMRFNRSLTAVLATAALSCSFTFAADGPPLQSPNLKHYYPLKPLENPQPMTVDVCVYGGTSGGVTAAIQSTRMGKTAVLLEFSNHVGGLTTGGLSATDGGSAAGGMAREFYARVGKLSGFAPAEAEKAMLDMLKEAGVPLLLEHRLVSATKDGNRISSIKCENGQVINAKMFIDATYEGDLFAAAGCSFHVGREANSVYKETINGIQPGQSGHNFNKNISPYVIPDDPSSGLLWGVNADGPGGAKGDGDNRIQAYNFRMQFEKGGLPFPKPTVYEPKRYELLLRYIAAGGGPGVYPHPGDNNNNGAFSTDHIGFNYDWPDGPERGDAKAERGEAYFRRLYDIREKIYQDHLSYQIGLVWFLCHDERVPKPLQSKISEWGMAKHSFEATGGWPHQLYIREGRRLMSDFVMTEHHCRGKEVVDDSIGLAQYTMDSHNIQRYATKDPKSGMVVVRNEGDVQDRIPGPYPVAYRSIVPKKAEVQNLLVPVSLSSSHIAFGSIRMEPVFMVLGQSAATAACMAIDAKSSVQDVPYSTLKDRLLADKQTLIWTGQKKQAGFDPAKLQGVVVDDKSAKFTGDWGHGTVTPGFIGDEYRHDGDLEKGTKSARFEVPVKEAGKYEVRVSYPALANRASNVPVTVGGHLGEVSKPVLVNQKKAPPIDKMFFTVGTFDFAAGATAMIEIGTKGTDGHVIVDAVQLVPAK